MNTINDEINRIKNAKEDIKQAIKEKGVDLDDYSRIDEYPAKILEIQGGSGQSLTRKELMRRVYILSK